jgi:hypothetical protein
VYAGVVIVFECAALQLQLHAQEMAYPGVLSEGLPQTEVYNSIVALMTAALWLHFVCWLAVIWSQILPSASLPAGYCSVQLSHVPACRGTAASFTAVGETPNKLLIAVTIAVQSMWKLLHIPRCRLMQTSMAAACQFQPSLVGLLRPVYLPAFLKLCCCRASGC